MNNNDAMKLLDLKLGTSPSTQQVLKRSEFLKSILACHKLSSDKALLKISEACEVLCETKIPSPNDWDLVPEVKGCDFLSSFRAEIELEDSDEKDSDPELLNKLVVQWRNKYALTLCFLLCCALFTGFHFGGPSQVATLVAMPCILLIFHLKCLGHHEVFTESLRNISTSFFVCFIIYIVINHSSLYTLILPVIAYSLLITMGLIAFLSPIERMLKIGWCSLSEIFCFGLWLIFASVFSLSANSSTVNVFVFIGSFIGFIFLNSYFRKDDAPLFWIWVLMVLSLIILLSPAWFFIKLIFVGLCLCIFARSSNHLPWVMTGAAISSVTWYFGQETYSSFYEGILNADYNNFLPMYCCALVLIVLAQAINYLIPREWRLAHFLSYAALSAFTLNLERITEGILP